MSSRLALPLIALFLLAIASWVILDSGPAEDGSEDLGNDSSLVSETDGASDLVDGVEEAVDGGLTDLNRTDVDSTPIATDDLMNGAAAGTIASFTGRIVDEEGKPVADVKIFAMAMVDWGASWDASRNVLPSDWGGVTDEDGRFALPEPPRDRLRFLLEFKHPDFATLELYNQPANPGRTRELGELTMDVGFSLAGIVVDPDGRPVANAEVVPFRGDGPRGFNPREVGKRPLLDPVTTDERGRFLLETLPTQPIRLKASAEFYFEAWSQAANGESGEQLEGMEIHLAEAVTAYGIVLDEARAPVAGANVEIRDSRWETGVEEAPFLATIETDADGKFSLILPGGTTRTRLTAGAENYYVTSVRLDEDSIVAPIEVQLTPIKPITGVVVDEGGSAVAGATVALLQARGNMPDPRNTPANASAVSDEDGTFELMPNLKSAWGGRFNVYAWDDNHAIGKSQLLQVRESQAGSPTELRIILARGFVASGRVLQPDGSAQAGALVHLRKLRNPRRSRLPSTNESQRGGDIVQRTTSASDGSFEFTNLPSGDYRLEAYHSGLSPVESDDFGLVDVDYQSDLRLAEACGIVGEVVGDIGAFRQLRVIATSPGMDRLEVFVDGKGTFEFMEMMPASWNLTLYDASDLAGNPSFTFGGGEPLARADAIEVRPGFMSPVGLELDISGLGRVTGLVRINGEPQPNYGVFVVPQMSTGSDQGGVGRRAIMRQMRSISTDYQGRFTLAGLQPNDYWILVTEPGGWPDMKFSSGNSAPEAIQRGIVSVSESGVVEYTFDIYLGGLQVNVSNPKGTDSTTMRLVPSPADGRRTRSSRLSRKGETFTDIPSGSYDLLIRVGGAWQTYSVSVPSLSTSTVDVALPLSKKKGSSSKKKGK